jgi:predicted O-linked N-acetylglucosamine transferase (SPINDLY family)
MSILASPIPLSLPGDEARLAEQMRRPGGLTGVPSGEGAQLARSAAALDVGALIELAASAGLEDAALLYRHWLGARSGDAAACGIWFNLGVVLMAQGDAAGAADAYRAALRLRPDLSEAAVNLGLALERTGQKAAALDAWRRALPPASKRVLLHNHLGRLFETESRFAEAHEELRASLLIDPAQPDVVQHLVHLRQRMAAWPPTELAVPGLTNDDAGLTCGPLAALALHDDPGHQAEVARAWLARKVAAAPVRLAPEHGYAHDRIRLGYLSSDFCRHAMSFLIAEVLERHDRDRFELFGYCSSPEDGSDIRARVTAAFDHHVPIAALSDEAAARRIRADEIDILIDLNGLTHGARLEVLRWKPAPVQATYLGYIGPVPLPELDWLICDDVAVPPDLAPLYEPTPLSLPGCYQANDSQSADLPAVSRQDAGLPQDAFVFCCMSHHYKITEATFSDWIAILAQVPGSVLWLVEDSAESVAALRRRWIAAGLAADRLIFAPRVDPGRYRARLALGDLFLDTSPYNAGTVASDALRMGLPMLTLRGRAFSARMAASLLTAVGRPDCIADSRADYVGRAVALAGDPARLAAWRAELPQAWRRTLGDSAAFTRKLEAAFEKICLRA